MTPQDRDLLLEEGWTFETMSCPDEARARFGASGLSMLRERGLLKWDTEQGGLWYKNLSTSEKTGNIGALVVFGAALLAGLKFYEALRK